MNSSNKTSVSWDSPETKAGLEAYAKSRMMSGIPELIRVAVGAYIRQRPPKPETKSYEALESFLG